MESLIPALVLLACPVGMGLMMWFMAKGSRRQRHTETGATPPSLEALREERRRVEAEIERREQRQDPTVWPGE